VNDQRHGDVEVAAPALRETADIWFDSGCDPVVRYVDACFWLVDGADPEQRLLLLEADDVPDADPRRIATVLAETLAACDFPPTADRASPVHVHAALRTAGLSSR